MTFVRPFLSLAIRGSTEISHRCKFPKRFNDHCAEKIKNSFHSKLPGITLYSNDAKSKCWKCNHPRNSSIFCSECNALQEPTENLNYFQVIGIKQDYNIESKEMQRKYRELQNILHPDRFSNRTENEKAFSENISSLINKAYKTLSNPLERGLYMLRLHNSSIPEGTSDSDPEFLMEIMEINVKVEEASGDKKKIIRLIEENNSILNTLSSKVSEAFEKKDIEDAKRLLTKMKYYASLQARLKNHKQELGIVD